MPVRLENIVNASVGAFVAELATLPICNIKTNYQIADATTIRQTITNIYAINGVRSFYAGLVPAIGSQVLTTAARYSLFKHLEETNLIFPYKFINSMTNGMISGVAASIATHPIDFVRIQLQANQSVSCEIKNYGLGVLYRGYSKSFSKILCGSALYLPLYTKTRNHISNPICASFVSAVVSTTLIHAVDYLKIRHVANKKICNWWKVSILFKGLSLNLLRIVPHFMIMMTTIDYLSKKNIFNF